MNKNAHQYVKRGLLSQSDFDFLAKLDPSATQKYLPFILKSYLAGSDLDLLRSRILEYDTLLQRNQVERRDINFFKTLKQLDQYVQKYNNVKSTGEIKREIKKEAITVLDNDNLFIVIPLSHQASCLYGAGTKWCTTAVNSIHWNMYFYEKQITFYYVQVRSDAIKKNLSELNPQRSQDREKIAVAVYPNGKMEVYDAADHLIASEKRSPDNLFNSLGVEPSLFQPKGIDERMEGLLEYKLLRGDTSYLDLSRLGISRIPDTIGNLIKLETLILSENKIQTLPETIGLLTNLKTLYLFNNQLTSLPESIGNLTKLEWLGLIGNSLSNGTIRELKRKFPKTRIYLHRHRNGGSGDRVAA